MKWPEFNKFNLKDRTILLGYVGSIAHGTYIPKHIDDKDVMGICIPPKEYYLGLQKFEQIQTFVEEYDVTIYEFKKFINLLIKNNPNVLGLLWLPDTCYIKIEDAGEKLIANKRLFSSKECYKSFTGYAYSQLKRMTHYKFEGYMGEKRKELVYKHGYDTKNASHLIRLLRMGMEFLSTEELNVFRHDNAQLLEIKQGKYELSEVRQLADDLFKKTEQAYLNSTLPNKPNYKAIEDLQIEILEGLLNPHKGEKGVRE